MKTLAPSSSVVGMVWVCNGFILCTQAYGVKSCERCLQHLHRVRAQANEQGHDRNQVLHRSEGAGGDAVAEAFGNGFVLQLLDLLMAKAGLFPDAGFDVPGDGAVDQLLLVLWRCCASSWARAW